LLIQIKKLSYGMISRILARDYLYAIRISYAR
jgi:hypothetical protein